MVAAKTLKSLKAYTALQLSGQSILAQISPAIRGDEHKQTRPSDVRLLLRTADLQGQSYQFPNHGHPDNELSTVPFDGNNAIVIMPTGDTARRQLFSAAQILARLKESGSGRVTPAFMQQEIIAPGLTRNFAAQAYGPAPFAEQAARFVAVDIPDGSDGGETIHPDITDDYAVGMRAPVREEAFLIVYADKPADIFMRAGDAAATCLSTLEKAIPASLKGDNTAAEHLDGFGKLAKGIVLAVDAATGGVKPVRLESAADIFNLARLPVVMVNAQKRIVAQYKPVF